MVLFKMMFDLKTIVKDNVARISFYRAGYCFYEIMVENEKFSFPVSTEDLGTATLTAEMKAITLMRYIRKALEEGTFLRAN